jgi:hypothetical protein
LLPQEHKAARLSEQPVDAKSILLVCFVICKRLTSLKIIFVKNIPPVCYVHIYNLCKILEPKDSVKQIGRNQQDRKSSLFGIFLAISFPKIILQMQIQN